MGVGRRNFIMTAAATSVGALAAASSARAAEPAPAPASQPAAASSAPAAPMKVGGNAKYDAVLKAAREKLYPRCRVCPFCDGEACAGEVPGLGGMGTGASFRNNVKALARVRLHMRTLHDVAKPDLTTTILGQKLSLPVMCASLGGTTYNMGAKMTEEAFIDAVLGGAQLAGTMGFIADGTEDPLATYKVRLAAMGRFGGRGVGVIKPRDQASICERVALIEEAGGTAVAIDIDSAGRSVRAAKLGQIIEPKTTRQLAEIARSTRLPLILKGVMTVEEAVAALDLGAKAIVVSNHGGRNLDHTPGTADVLPAIAKEVKGKLTILADGGVRYGADVLKMLALGADAVLVGRPAIRGAHGGGAEGVQVVLEKMKSELAEAMVLTGTASVRAVSARAVSIA
jgi:isopentenyl diphosphate isomerase/L-lactate dehydrogenase-like FMN-dependent dehydrogenase